MESLSLCPLVASVMFGSAILLCMHYTDIMTQFTLSHACRAKGFALVLDSLTVSPHSALAATVHAEAIHGREFALEVSRLDES